ncbi:MAG: histidine kinase, partial [Pedobacter sp.]|uniref:histidine kinase n=1 Tax=Pedobacter sp. TaxID=1411316 RepID=UPI003395E836
MPDLLYEIRLKNSLSNIREAYGIHILCWIIFILYEMSMTTMINGFRPFTIYVLFYILNISLFYFHSTVVLKKAFTNSIFTILYIILSTLLELLSYFLLTYIITVILKKTGYQQYQTSFFTRLYMSVTLWRAIYFISFATGYYFLLRYFQRKKKMFQQDIENEKLKNDVLRAEQDFLRAQINPHLLFNTLSFIKYAAKK